MAAADFVAPAGAAVQGIGAGPGAAPNRVPVRCELEKPGAVVLVDAAGEGKAVVVVAVARVLRPASAVTRVLQHVGDSLATAGARLGTHTEGTRQQHLRAHSLFDNY